MPLFAALLFVVHPVQTQAVTYIVQRLTSLTTLFYLLSCVLYVQARLQMAQNSEPGPQPQPQPQPQPVPLRVIFLFAGSVLMAVLAMKTKETAFTLPLSILLYEIYFFRGPWKRRLLCLLPIMATLLIVPMTVLDIDGATSDILTDSGEQLRVGSHLSRWDYLVTQIRVIVTYLRLLVYPIKQNLDYDYPIYTTFFTLPILLSFLLLAALFPWHCSCSGKQGTAE
ncbi:MAG: hypothetical protein ACSLFC_03195 [Desulfuromonadales bacterium]